MSKYIKNYYTNKFLNVIFLTGILVVCFWLIEVALIKKFLIIGSGLISGILIGKIRWSISQKLYDSIYFIPISILSEISLVLFLIYFLIYFEPHIATNTSLNIFFVIPIVLFIMLSIWNGYIYMMLYNIYSLKDDSIAKIVKDLFYQPANGQESMIDQTAIVLSKCNPIGTIKYNSVIWNAETIDRVDIEKGEKVVIKDVKGLKTYIEKL